MDKTMIELFAGVGGFRCGLNNICKKEDAKNEIWNTVWFNQWEPADKKIQWAHGCYVNNFGICLDLEGNDSTNVNISNVDAKNIPNHNLLCGGFPCFEGNTLILTDQGLVEIKNITTSNTVTVNQETYKILRKEYTGNKETIKLTFDDGYEVVCTPNHKFFSWPHGWIEAKNTLNETLMTSTLQSFRKIRKIEYNGFEDVYDIEVEDIHCFPLKNGVLAHNCQDYSVASTLTTSKGIEGKKGILWWDIRNILEEKKTPFVLLENVDRLVKSPAKQRGRDFGIILACLRDLDYTVEWRIINAADYGFQQRRRRTFIFAYKNNTKFKSSLTTPFDILQKNGFFAKAFSIKDFEESQIKQITLPVKVGEVSKDFSFNFETAGVMINGIIYTVKVTSNYSGSFKTLKDIIETTPVDKKFFIEDKKLYFTSKEVNHSDESVTPLPKEQRQTWQYIKGAKKIMRETPTGYKYLYSEGPVPMIDEYDKPARTLLTSEGSFSRTTHIIRDKLTNNIRLLTPKETERIQGFPDDWTKECLNNSEIINISDAKRRFLMGNALVVDVIKQMEPVLNEIISNE